MSDLGSTVEPGQVTGFLGPNGAGKTTTLRPDLLNAWAGALLLLGHGLLAALLGTLLAVRRDVV